MTIDSCHNLNFEKELPLDAASVSPSGSSYRQYFHFLQLIQSGEQSSMASSYLHNISNIFYESIRRFQKYDHGSAMNMAMYKAPKPPEYNLSNIQTKVHIIYGQNDHVVKAEVCFFHPFA